MLYLFSLEGQVVLYLLAYKQKKGSRCWLKHGPCLNLTDTVLNCKNIDSTLRALYVVMYIVVVGSHYIPKVLKLNRAQRHESSVGLSSTTNPNLGVASHPSACSGTPVYSCKRQSHLGA